MAPSWSSSPPKHESAVAAYPGMSPNELAPSASGASTPLRDVSPAEHPGSHPHSHLPQRLLALQQLRGAESSSAGSTRRPTSRSRKANAFRSTAGGAHAAAGSPSPERTRGALEPEETEEMESVLGKAPPGSVGSSNSRPSSRGRRAELRSQFQDERPGPSKSTAGPPEDKYFKILQNLQAKGAVGARGKLLEGAGLRDRRENRLQALSDSASFSRQEFSRSWAPLSRSSPVKAAARPTRRHRLAADSESEDSRE